MRYYGLVDRESVRAVEHLWRSQYERLLDVIAAYALDATCVEYAAVHDGDPETRDRLERFIGASIDWTGVRGELRHHNGGVPRRFAPLYRRVMSLGRQMPARRVVIRKRGVAPSASIP